MAIGPEPRVAQAQIGVERIDEGLRSLLQVYNYMGLGLAITGVVAFLVAATPALYEPIFTTPLKWVVMLAPLGFVFFLSAKIQTMSVSAAQITFWAFAAVMGLSMASIFLVFTGASIARVLHHRRHVWRHEPVRLHHEARPVGLGLVPVHGPDRHHHRDAGQHLSAERGPALRGQRDWRAGVHRPHRLRHPAHQEMYYELDASDVATRKAIMGALSLYLNFINMFMLLLNLFGTTRE